MKYCNRPSIRTPRTATEFLMVQSQAERSRIPPLHMPELCPGCHHAPGTGMMPHSGTDSGDLQVSNKSHEVSFCWEKKHCWKSQVTDQAQVNITKVVLLVFLIQAGQVSVSSVKICSRTSADRSSSHRQAWSGLSLTGGLLLWWGGSKTRQAHRARGRGCKVADEEEVKVPLASKWPSLQ